MSTESIDPTARANEAARVASRCTIGVLEISGYLRLHVGMQCGLVMLCACILFERIAQTVHTAIAQRNSKSI